MSGNNQLRPLFLSKIKDSFPQCVPYYVYQHWISLSFIVSSHRVAYCPLPFFNQLSSLLLLTTQYSLGSCVLCYWPSLQVSYKLAKQHRLQHGSCGTTRFDRSAKALFTPILFPMFIQLFIQRKTFPLIARPMIFRRILLVKDIVESLWKLHNIDLPGPQLLGPGHWHFSCCF